MDEFRTKLASLLNECSMENGSDTPDFILADYLTKCLRVFDETMSQRAAWYGDPQNVPQPTAAQSGKGE